MSEQGELHHEVVKVIMQERNRYLLMREAADRGLQAIAAMSLAQRPSSATTFLDDFVKHLEPHMEGDGECLNGADAVDWLAGQYFKAKAILEKVEVGH